MSHITALLALTLLVACGLPPSAGQPDAWLIDPATPLNPGEPMQISPCFPVKVIPPGGIVESSVINSIQEQICAIANAAEMVAWQGHAHSVDPFTITSTGALESLATISVGMSPIVKERWTLKSVLYRVLDNGSDVWTCNAATVDADDAFTAATPVASTGSGTWEWVQVDVGHLFARGDRFVVSCSTPNVATTSMLLSGVLLVFI